MQVCVVTPDSEAPCSAKAIRHMFRRQADNASFMDFRAIKKTPRK